MSEMTRVTQVDHLGGRLLRVTFSDGLVRELDFADALIGFLAAVDDDMTFASARLDAVAGTVCWPGGIDLDPDVLHGDHAAASEVEPRLVREYRLRQAG
ncbi:MAG: DUF2442 domain-containing protein [Actinomycetota bacterium]|jgi:hypothetical protein